MGLWPNFPSFHISTVLIRTHALSSLTICIFLISTMCFLITFMFKMNFTSSWGCFFLISWAHWRSFTSCLLFCFVFNLFHIPQEVEETHLLPCFSLSFPSHFPSYSLQILQIFWGKSHQIYIHNVVVVNIYKTSIKF